MGMKRSVCVVLVLVLLLWPAMASVGSAQAPGQGQKPAEPSAGAEAAAVFANVFYPPGKLILCAVGTGVGVAVMLASFGLKYEDGVRFLTGTCGGKWYVSAEQMERAVADPQAK